MYVRCNYNPDPSDGRKRCHKRGSVTVKTLGGGMATRVCSTHVGLYIANGWYIKGMTGQHEIERRTVSAELEGHRRALQLAHERLAKVNADIRAIEEFISDANVRLLELNVAPETELETRAAYGDR